MIILGVPLRRPTFGELTRDAVIAITGWLIIIAIGDHTRAEAAIWLVCCGWGAVSPSLGINLLRGGWRHLALWVAGQILLLQLVLGLFLLLR